ncbi:hypothetical protein K1T71_010003 [Dendrolimus kikuchii]|uniref:Uncharacterized protein n=1 Tax=Dendrolimus kikuchii TaxID=765133 RepID=A0ACC1CTN5_9NEOP|nr:hypothetical protein K1T71_010003 [Dendrolimus kikuchii]
MDINFANKVVLITGASSGIGETSAILFSKYDAKLVLVGRNETNLLNVANRCEKERGLKPLAIVADLSTDEGCERTVKATLEHFGRLDVLVNNAAIGGPEGIENATMEKFDKLFNNNLRSVYNLTRLLVPAIIESKGNIINISSLAGIAVAANNLPYGMAKAALTFFTRVTSVELAPKGVRVNTICPGITATNFRPRMTGQTAPEYQEWLKVAEQTIPMRKACEAGDIANMVVFVASDNCKLVTGTTINVDGGMQFGDVYGFLRDKSDKSDKTDKSNKSDKKDKSDNTDNSNNSDKLDNSDNSDKLDNSDNSDKSNNSDKLDNSDNSDNSDKSDKSDNSDNSDISDKLDKSDNSDKSEKLGHL